MILAESGEVDRRAMDRFRYAPISIVHLSQAIAKIAAWQTPMRLNDTTRTYFERLATLSSPERVAVQRTNESRESHGDSGASRRRRAGPPFDVPYLDLAKHVRVRAIAIT